MIEWSRGARHPVVPVHAGHSLAAGLGFTIVVFGVLVLVVVLAVIAYARPLVPALRTRKRHRRP